MRNANAVKNSAEVILWLFANSRIVSGNMIAAAIPARANADFQVGGVLSRRSRAVCRVCFFFSSAESGRPVRPRASIVPAAVPRCFVRRLRLVWAIAKGSLVCVGDCSDGILDHALVVDGH